MKYAIKDLAEGRVAVYNDGSLTQLQTVLSKAFPSSQQVTSGGFNFYFRQPASHLKWTFTDFPQEIPGSLPTQSVKDFELWEPVYGEDVEVRDGNEAHWNRAKFLAISLRPDTRNKYVVETDYGDATTSWKQIRKYEPPTPVPPVVTLTLQEIADRLGIPVGQLRIKD